MTAPTNRVTNSFQTLNPSSTEATIPAGANSWGETVASAEGETKLPVMLTMMAEKVSKRTFFFFFFCLVLFKKNPQRPERAQENGRKERVGKVGGEGRKRENWSGAGTQELFLGIRRRNVPPSSFLRLTDLRHLDPNVHSVLFLGFAILLY